MIEFDRNQSYVMKDICLELSTSIKEIEKLIGKSYNSDAKDQINEIVKRLADSVIKLEKL
jgi:hypothetical protein